MLLEIPLILKMLRWHVTKSNNTPGGGLNKTSTQNDVAEGILMPPNLETFIPEGRLPDVIDVYANFNTFSTGTTRNMHVWKQYIARHPIKFVRQYPRCTPTNEGHVNGSKPSDDRPDRDRAPKKVLTGQLDLRNSKHLGTGNHSEVVLAPLTIPSTPSVYHTVAVKSPFPYDEQMLLNEAKIYNAFPRKIQDSYTPVVPKFYGCYAPSIEAFDRDNNRNNGCDDLNEEKRIIVRNCLNFIAPILLLEACGERVHVESLSHTDRKAIETLLKRLHKANFVQRSFYARNIVVQPGPLWLPPAYRSLDEPSYRIIDFGRALGFGINCSSPDLMYTEAEEERYRALEKSLVPYY